MEVIVGHSNSDLDCFGSMVLARYLYPGAVAVRSRLIHPVARNVYHLYRDHLKFARLEDLQGETIERVIVVDTRTLARVHEYFDAWPDFAGQIEVWDHHPADDASLPGALIHEGHYGANTTLLGRELMRRRIRVDHVDATIALAGIYADTGNFTHENVTPLDFRVASYLVGCGAAIDIVRRLLRKLAHSHQVSLFHELLNRLVYLDLYGHFLILALVELDRQENGMAAIVEEVFEIENPDALFVVFAFRKTRQLVVIGRSQREEIPANRILAGLGGGGHLHAASAQLKNRVPAEVFVQLRGALEHEVRPALTAQDLATRPVDAVRRGDSLLAASLFLESVEHTGAPVLDEDDRLVGILTLRDIMKGRKAGQMQAPVSAYMTRKVVTIAPDRPVREVEQTILGHNIGHLPVVEQGRVTGIITRSDVLRHLEHREKEEAVVRENTFALDAASR